LTQLSRQVVRSWSWGPGLAEAAALLPNEQHQLQQEDQQQDIHSSRRDVSGHQEGFISHLLLDGASSTGSRQVMQAGEALLPGAGSAPSSWGSGLVDDEFAAEEQWEQNTRGRMLAVNPNSK
jgi:hypothetical protein